jgi:dihydropteroate synthase
MGIVNVTPDSFSDGGRHATRKRAVAHAIRLVAEGAALLDVGGESSRPGAEPVGVDEELRRVIPVIERLAESHPSVPISVDTCKPAVAEAALEAGASIVNDITGLADPAMRAVVARAGAPVVVMHMKGTPRTMQRRPVYKDVVGEVTAFFEERIRQAAVDGVTRLILDPGIGFGKSVAHNLILLNRLDRFVALGYPVLVGASRKTFIGAVGGGVGPDEREPGTVAVTALAVAKGASIIRVHDVAANRQGALVAAAIIGERAPRA